MLGTMSRRATVRRESILRVVVLMIFVDGEIRGGLGEEIDLSNE